MFIAPLRWSATFALTAACCSAAMAQPRAIPDAHLHRVAPGDTLSSLAQRYGGDARQWGQLQAINRLDDPRRLVPGTLLQLPPGWARQHMMQVEVEALSGTAYLLSSAGGAREPLAVGMHPGEGSLIETAADSTVQLRLADGSTLQLAPHTRIRLDRLRQPARNGSSDARWSLEQGRVDSQVTPQPTRGRRFEIRTPYAVASVRGTTFSVAVTPGDSARSEVYTGAVEMRHPRGARVRLAPGQGASASARQLSPATTLPAAPTLPAEWPDAVSSGTALALQLPEPATGTHWRVRITPAGAAGPVLRDITQANARVEFAALAPGLYRVWVQARDAAGLLGPATGRDWRVRALPPAPLYEAPPAGAHLATPEVALRCTRPEGADAFRLQIARDPDFKDLVDQAAALSECRYVTSLPPGRYHWRVASLARDASGQLQAGPFSAGQAFERVPLPEVPTPRVGQPARGLDVQWDGQPGWRYRTQVSAHPDFGQTLYERVSAEPRLNLPDWPAGRYLVRVQATDTWGQTSPFSAAQAVVVKDLWQSGDGRLIWRDGTGASLQPAP